MNDKFECILVTPGAQRVVETLFSRTCLSDYLHIETTFLVSLGWSLYTGFNVLLPVVGRFES